MAKSITRSSTLITLFLLLFFVLITVSACSFQSISRGVPLVSSPAPTETKTLRTSTNLQVPPSPTNIKFFPTVTPESTIAQFLPSPNIEQFKSLFPGSEIHQKIDFSITEVGMGKYELIYRSEDGFVTLESPAAWRLIRKTFPVQIKENEGVFMRFKFSPFSTTRVYLKALSDDDTELRWGFIPYDFAQTYIKEGELRYFKQWITGDLILQPDHWYNVVLIVGDQGDFSVQIWDPENPEKRNEFQKTLSGNWEDLQWELEIHVNSGSYSIREIWEFSSYEN